MTRGASRHQHDTLDQTIAKAIRDAWMGEKIPNDARQLAAAVRDALLAEGIECRWQPDYDGESMQWPFGYISPAYDAFNVLRPGDKRVLVIPLLVGVGCGNAKKDTP